LTILAFAATALGVAIARDVTRGHQGSARPAASWQRVAVVVLGAALLALLWALGYTLVTGRHALTVAHVFTTPRNPTRLQVYIALVVGMLTVVSPLWRRVVRGVPTSTVWFFAGGAVAAAWLSLGPVIHANGISIGGGVYDVFYRWVPGWDGLRAPARNFMLVAFFLSVLAGLGAATVIAHRPRARRLLLIVGMVAIVVEGWSAPINTNRLVGSPGYVSPPPVTATGKQLPPLYRMIRDLPSSTVVAEFPFGDPAYEIFYSFYAGYHRKPILNGYSGFFPESYQRNLEQFSRGPLDEDTWTALLSSGATHVIVHEGAYVTQEARQLLEWLRRHGSREIGVFDTDHVFQLH
jgi:hypothetical protein